MKNLKFALVLLAAIFLTTAAFAQSAAQDPHLAKAVELRAEAIAAYDYGDYDAAADLARRAKAELALIAAIPKAAPAEAIDPPAEPLKPSLPASYTVRLITGDRDCLSKIAGYPFIYGDGAKWTILYMANKLTLKHPENADIILPAEVLVIPSIAGETREGSFSPDLEYPAFVD